MLTVEEALDLTLIEEGQYLMGLDFITNVLGLSWDNISKIFYKTIKEYARRRPIKETRVIDGGINGSFVMPEGTLAVRAIRYDILDDYPRTMFTDFGQLNYEYEEHTRRLRTFPPMSSLRVTYAREYKLTDEEISVLEYMADYENSYYTKLLTKPKKGCIVITKDGKSMKEVGIEKKVIDMGPGRDHAVQQVIKLSGDLGKGYYRPDTRELDVTFKKGTASDLVISYTPYYKVAPELSTGDYIFMKFFKSYILEAIAALRSQATQRDLQNIDLNSDDLHARAMILKAEVERNLRESIDFGSMAPI